LQSDGVIWQLGFFEGWQEPEMATNPHPIAVGIKNAATVHYVERISSGVGFLTAT
jgi:hypothetical protein